MTKSLEQALAKVAALPEAAQQTIAEDIVAHVEGLEHLRAAIQKGIDSLDRGEWREIDIEDIIRTARAEYDRE